MRFANERESIEKRIQDESDRRQTQRMNYSAAPAYAAGAPEVRSGPTQPVQYAKGSYLDNLMSNAHSQHYKQPGMSYQIAQEQVDQAPSPPKRIDDIDDIELKMKREITKEDQELRAMLAASNAALRQHTHTLQGQYPSSSPPRQAAQSSSPVNVVPNSAPERMDEDRHSRLQRLQDRVSSIPTGSEQPSRSVMDMRSEELAAVIQQPLPAAERNALISPPRSSNIMRLRAQLEQVQLETQDEDETR